MAARVIAYERNGDPASVLCALTLAPRDPLSGKSINVKILLSPINPADLHVVHGTYATEPVLREVNVNGQEKKLRLPGNEGLGEIAEVGPDVTSVKKGDWVVFSKGQSGTWSSSQVLEEKDVIKVHKESGISAVNVGTLAVRCSVHVYLVRKN
jgi:trans-2-enoyl-CoA reductase